MLLTIHLICSISLIVCIIGLIIFIILEFNGLVPEESFIAFMVCSASLVIPSVISGALLFEDSKTYYREVAIKSLRTELEYNGHFVLGTGNLEGKTYYFYYYEVEPNIYALGKVETSKSVIYETNEVEPKLVTSKEKHKKEENKFYVPIGTINVSYSL